jgi:hypothetical protein
MHSSGLGLGSFVNTPPVLPCCCKPRSKILFDVIQSRAALLLCFAADPPTSPSDMRAELLLDVAQRHLKAVAVTSSCTVQDLVHLLHRRLYCRAAANPTRKPIAMFNYVLSAVVLLQSPLRALLMCVLSCCLMLCWAAWKQLHRPPWGTFCWALTPLQFLATGLGERGAECYHR